MSDKKDLKFGFLPTRISNKQAGDTGMAIVLIFLLIGFFTNNIIYYKIAIPILVINMIYPRIYYPLAIIWLGFSHLLGTVVSKIILTIIYFILVFPIGIIRKMAGKDSLKLKQFKKGNKSVMKIRKQVYCAEDIINPY